MFFDFWIFFVFCRIFSCLLKIDQRWLFTIIRWPLLYAVCRLLVSNIDCFNTLIGKKCAYVSIFVFGFVFWVNLFLS